MATSRSRGASSSRGGRTGTVGSDYYHDESPDVILPTPPPGSARGGGARQDSAFRWRAASGASGGAGRRRRERKGKPAPGRREPQGVAGGRGTAGAREVRQRHAARRKAAAEARRNSRGAAPGQETHRRPRGTCSSSLTVCAVPRDRDGLAAGGGTCGRHRPALRPQRARTAPGSQARRPRAASSSGSRSSSPPRSGSACTTWRLEGIYTLTSSVVGEGAFAVPIMFGAGRLAVHAPPGQERGAAAGGDRLDRADGRRARPAAHREGRADALRTGAAAGPRCGPRAASSAWPPPGRSTRG